MIVTIDPGISGTGIAVFLKDKLQYAKSFSYPGKNKTMIERSQEYCDRLDKIFIDQINGQPKFYIEKPDYYDSDKGKVCAESGGLFKLIFFVGFLTCHIVRKGYDVTLIPFSNWKGNLSKRIVQM